MAREWTDEEVKKEIADAIAIVREDRFETFVRSRIPSTTNNPPNPANPPTNPPNGNPAENDPPKSKKSLWWGEVENA